MEDTNGLHPPSYSGQVNDRFFGMMSRYRLRVYIFAHYSWSFVLLVFVFYDEALTFSQFH